MGTAGRHAVAHAPHLEPGCLFAQLPVKTVLGRGCHRQDHPVDESPFDGPRRVVEQLDPAGFERHDHQVC